MLASSCNGLHPNRMNVPDIATGVALNWIRTSTHHAQTVVLIHAVGHDLTYWDRQIETLSQTFNVVAFDLPGHGRSAGRPAAWSFEYASAVTARLIEETSSGPVHLIGISFGGMIAQVTALVRPDLIRSLTLIGTAASFREEVRSGMRARAALVRSEGMAAVVDSSLQRWFTERTLQSRPDIVDRITKTLLGDDPATHAAIWELIATLDIQGRLSELECPTLVLVGQHDPSTPPLVAEGLANSIHDARLVEIPDASHIVTFEAPSPVSEALLSFLMHVDE